jgi:hypothetical protein
LQAIGKQKIDNFDPGLGGEPGTLPPIYGRVALTFVYVSDIKVLQNSWAQAALWLPGL